MAQKQTIEDRFKKLNDRDHILLRPGRYIGSTKAHTSTSWIYNPELKKMEKREVTYNPGFLKMFDELVTNSVDHSKRPEGKHLDVIRVEADQATGEIIVYDNGGIPVVIHQEEQQWLPEMLFGEVKAGSNFDDADEAELAGQNGEGASLTNIFSEFFTVETCDSKKKFKIKFTENNGSKSAVKVVDAEGDKGFTRLTYKPDYARLSMDGLDDDNYAMLLTRVVEIAGTNSHLKVYFNGERILIRTFKDYIELFAEEYAYEEVDKWKIGVAPSDDGFQTLTYVNATRVRGGTHIDYVGMQICNRLREHFKKKHKVDVKPSEIRPHLMLFIDCSIVNPRYSSQTKDELITEVRDFGNRYEVSDKLIQRILKSAIIQSVLDWVEAKEFAQQKANERAAGKEIAKADPRKVEKFSDALERNDRSKCILFLTEGDSAAKAVQAGRDKNPYIGSFPLRGKPLNVRDKKESDILNNEEIKKILIITGLQFGVTYTSLEQLRFGKIASTTDADVDGSHICGLLYNLLDKYWPELIDMGFFTIFRTPLVKVFLKDKSVLEFFTEREFKNWVAHTGEKLKGWNHKYYKGLGTSSTKEFKEYFANMAKYLFTVTVEDENDKDAVDLAFNGSRAADRKVWLETPAKTFEDFISDELPK